MIQYIEGRLVEKNPAYAVIDCGGLGYALQISLNTFSALGELNQPCKLFTHLAIKNEATTPVGLVMYGFHSVREREIFLHLISVSGVGSNTARLIISSMTADEVAGSILGGNVGAFQNVKGIGAKTAQKIIIDLKDKIGKISGLSEKSFPMHNTNRDEALSALVLLGFNRIQAEKAVDKVLQTDPAVSVEELIKQTLRIL